MVTTMSSIIYKYYMSILFLIWAMFPALHLHYWGLLASDVGDGNENVNSAIRCFFPLSSPSPKKRRFGHRRRASILSFVLLPGACHIHTLTTI